MGASAAPKKAPNDHNYGQSETITGNQ